LIHSFATSAGDMTTPLMIEAPDGFAEALEQLAHRT
jgi:hypothetical protein